jgi:predicted enzyme related to lactoylglutathione lyase
MRALRTPLAPLDPDPAFAARLRDRLDRAFDLPKGVTVSNLTLEPASPPTVGSSPAVITPYLAVVGAQGAIEWYTAALGAQLRGDPIIMPDGRVGHAELVIAGGLVMLSEEHPEIGVSAPAPGQGAAVTIHLTVADVDAVMARAVAAGADLQRPIADYDYGRNGVIRDPFGHRWLISSDLPAPTGPRHGDLGYASLWVPDIERAAAFFSTVLGWRYGPGSSPDGRQIEGLNLHHGLWGGEPHATLFQCFAVDDVDAAIGRVRSAGGTAAAPTVEPYGRISECVDDQGVRFAVYQPPGGVSTGPAPAPNGSRAGDLSYVTMEVVDSARTRAFYGAVLGWRFAPGRVGDGWGVEDAAPMTGLHGGHQLATTVPMYRVDDIHAAVGRVRAAGGAATDPEVQPYGTTSDCRDDQGTRFYLGTL